MSTFRWAYKKLLSFASNPSSLFSLCRIPFPSSSSFVFRVVSACPLFLHDAESHGWRDPSQGIAVDGREQKGVLRLTNRGHLQGAGRLDRQWYSWSRGTESFRSLRHSSPRRGRHESSKSLPQLR